MLKSIKKQIGILGFVMLLGVVVYLKTVKKMDRIITESPDIDQQEAIINYSREQEQRSSINDLDNQRRERDSMANAQRDTMEAKRQKMLETLKKLEKDQ